MVTLPLLWLLTWFCGTFGSVNAHDGVRVETPEGVKVENHEGVRFEGLGVHRIEEPKFQNNTFNCSEPVEITYDLLSSLKRANASALIDSFNGKYYEFNYEKAGGALPTNGNSTLNKRCFPTGEVVSVREWQTVQSGTWWSPWYPISCCTYCDKGPRGCQILIGYGFTYTWSVSHDVGFNFGQIAASTSLSITESHQEALGFTCDWDGGAGPAQVWYQQEVYWADFQYRDRLVGDNYCTYIEDWSEYIRADAPIDDQTNMGCSVGFENTQCDGMKCWS